MSNFIDIPRKNKIGTMENAGRLRLDKLVNSKVFLDGNVLNLRLGNYHLMDVTIGGRVILKP